MNMKAHQQRQGSHARKKKPSARKLSRVVEQMQESGHRLYQQNEQVRRTLIWATGEFQSLLQRFPAIRDDKSSTDLVALFDNLQRQIEQQRKDGSTDEDAHPASTDVQEPDQSDQEDRPGE